MLTEKNWFRTGLCLVVLIALEIAMQAAVFASQRKAVEWSELGAHLAENAVSLESMPVVDCPSDIEGGSARHLVCQIIENTFYKWKEYEVVDEDGEIRLAIEMIEPEPGLLTAEEARLLLNGSKQWERQRPELPTAMETGPCPTEHRNAKNPAYPGGSRVNKERLPVEASVCNSDDVAVDRAEPFSPDTADGYSIVPESVIGGDERERVTNTETYPWNSVCYIGYSVAGEGFRGSGALVSPLCVLTCGHNLWDNDRGVWSENVEVSAGQRQYYEGGPVEKPYGTVWYSSIHTNSAYTQGEGYEYDYGMITLQESFPGINTFMPLVFDYTTSYVNIAGYPGAGPGESNSYSMWHAAGDVVGYEGIDDRIMLHQVDTTSGQSGAPVWVYDPSAGTRRLVAIHVFSRSGGANGACRLVSANEQIISEWMASSVVSYDDVAYIPYFINDEAEGLFTGLAFANRNADSNSIKLDYYANSGALLGSETRTIESFGQTSFTPDVAEGSAGWVKISSEAPLDGLALVASSSPQSLFDIDLKNSLHSSFLLPHIGVSENWSSSAMICNPGAVAATITFKHYDPDGNSGSQKTLGIPANGSVQQDLYALFRQNLSGSVVIESTRPVTAFLLYENETIVWRAGLSAIPLD